MAKKKRHMRSFTEALYGSSEPLMTAENLATGLMAYLGHSGTESLLEAMGEACCMDNPDTDLVRLHETLRRFYKAECGR